MIITNGAAGVLYPQPPPYGANADPFRTRPAELPMTRFLIQIGQEAAHSAQPEPEVDLSCSPEQERQNCIRAALQLGDIERVGET
ncbi:MAG: hypothetical protein ACRC7P_07405, partial [Enterovibrio sp.]